MQLTSQLSLVEMLGLMQGNFGAIQGLSRKLKDTLQKNVGTDTPDNRKKLANKEADKLKSLITVSPQV